MSKMLRIQLHLTEAQNRRLEALAEERGTSRAELIRRGIDSVLVETEQGGDPLLQLVGQAGPGPSDDGSERHDQLLYGGSPLPHALAAEGEPRL